MFFSVVYFLTRDYRIATTLFNCSSVENFSSLWDHIGQASGNVGVWVLRSLQLYKIVYLNFNSLLSEGTHCLCPNCEEVNEVVSRKCINCNVDLRFPKVLDCDNTPPLDLNELRPSTIKRLGLDKQI